MNASIALFLVMSASPALAGSSARQPNASAPTEAAIARGIQENSESIRAFLEGATVYAAADDLSAAAELRKREWKSLNDRFWEVRADIARLRAEHNRRQIGAAAEALGAKQIPNPLLNEISAEMRAAGRLELAHKAIFNDMMAAFEADAQALQSEQKRRAGRRRTLMLFAGALGAAAAAALLAALLLKRRPAAPPPKKHPLALPKRRGPGRLQ